MIKTWIEFADHLILHTTQIGPSPNKQTRSGVFIVNFKHNSHLVLVFLFLTLGS